MTQSHHHSRRWSSEGVALAGVDPPPGVVEQIEVVVLTHLKRGDAALVSSFNR